MANVKQMKKLDIHAHATPFPQWHPNLVAGRRFVSPEDVIGFYDQLGIEKGVLLPLTSPEGVVTPKTSEACKWITEQYPDRFFWFCGVDPRAMKNAPTAELCRLIEFYKGLGAKGVGELTANIYADDPKIDILFACCAELDMPVTIHISPRLSGYGIVDELGLPRIEKMLKKHPNLTLLGHSSPFWSEISADNSDQIRGGYPTGKVKEGRLAGLMRDYGNLYCDLSAGSGCNAMMRDPEYAARFIDEFADRMLYGCDICWADSTFPFQFQKFLDSLLDQGSITPENYSKIVRHNAEKILKL